MVMMLVVFGVVVSVSICDVFGDVCVYADHDDHDDADDVVPDDDMIVMMMVMMMTLLCDSRSSLLTVRTLASAITRAFLCFISPARFRTIVASRPASTSPCLLPLP